MVMHSATTTLDDIIDELRLKYDSSVGLLDGDAIRELPSLNTLQNLNKLLSKLSKNLGDSDEKCSLLLQHVDKALLQLRLPEEGDADEEDAAQEDGKRDRDDDFEDESVPLAKRRKQASLQSEDNDDDADDEGALQLGVEDGPANGHEINSKHDPVPPEQVGSYTQDNDTRLKNPKSEFVSSQTLSASAIAELGLFSEENNGLETQGKEYLKKKYGVASYPENDLKSMLPGEIPNVDFSKSKPPANQVQFTTYQTYIESFFRPFSNEDITFLNEKFVLPPGFEKSDYDPLVSPYLIPKLGAFYADLWAEEDATLGSKLSSPALQRPPLESYKPKGDYEELTDEKMLTEDVTCGPFSSRLLSAVLSIHEGNKEKEEGENGLEPEAVKKEESILSDTLFAEDVATQLDSGETYKVTSETNDFYSMEERLKRELKYIGIFMNLPNQDDDKPKKGNIMDSDDWLLHREDDEVCSEIRALQEELRVSVLKNRRRKKALLPVLEEQLAYQEYNTILEDLDKQVDQAYIKRLKAKSKKKKQAQEMPNTAQQQAANSGLRSLLEKRNRWINNIGKLFKPPEVMKRIPSESVFENGEQSDEEDGETEMNVVNEEET